MAAASTRLLFPGRSANHPKITRSAVRLKNLQMCMICSAVWVFSTTQKKLQPNFFFGNMWYERVRARWERILRGEIAGGGKVSKRKQFRNDSALIDITSRGIKLPPAANLHFKCPPREKEEGPPTKSQKRKVIFEKFRWKFHLTLWVMRRRQERINSFWGNALYFWQTKFAQENENIWKKKT